MQVRTPSQNTTHHDTSLELFDIDENDFEYDFHQPDDFEDSFNLDLNANNTFSFHPSYQQQLLQSQPRHLQHYPSPIQHPFGDPFHATNVTDLGGGHVLSSISESVEHHFHTGQGAFLPVVAEEGAYYHFPGQGRGTGMYPTPTYVPVPSASAPPGISGFGNIGPTLGAGFTLGPESNLCGGPIKMGLMPTKQEVAGGKKSPSDVAVGSGSTEKESVNMPAVDAKKSGCSVCLSPSPRTLAVLIPCGHPLCSGCLTSALNIVGEKDMECAVCKKGVEDFKLIVVGGALDGKEGDQKKPSDKSANTSGGKQKLQVTKETRESPAPQGKSFLDPLFPSPATSVSGHELDLDGIFEFGEVEASTPKLNRRELEPVGLPTSGAKEAKKDKSHVVLRIDNVPWVCAFFFTFECY